MAIFARNGGRLEKYRHLLTWQSLQLIYLERICVSFLIGILSLTCAGGLLCRWIKRLSSWKKTTTSWPVRVRPITNKAHAAIDCYIFLTRILNSRNYTLWVRSLVRKAVERHSWVFSFDYFHTYNNPGQACRSFSPTLRRIHSVPSFACLARLQVFP